MSTVGATTTTGTSATGTSASSLTASGSSGKEIDRFLKILTTQLQNQNPLDPMKPAEFSSQLTQYSQLEQQIKFNEKLDTLITNGGKASVSPLSYLNTTVDYYSDTAPVQEGKATWSYVANGAASVSLRVEDSLGTTLYNGSGDISAGSHAFAFPNSLPNGTPLKLTVTATDASGKTVESTINAKAKINAVNTVDGSSILEANGFFVTTDLVTRVEAPPTTQSSS